MASPFDSQYNDIRNKVIYYANKYGIDKDIFIWQIWFENNFRNTGCSSANACGIAQFIPATAQRFGVDRNNIDSSLDGAARYMKWLLAQSYINGNYALALAGYNAGEGNVKKYKGIPPFTETKNYVSKILSAAKNKIATSNTVTQVVNNNQQITGQNLPFVDTLQKETGFTKDELFILGGVILLLVL